MDAVDAAHSRHVAKDNLVRSNADHRTVSLKESLDGHTLLETSDMGCEPEVRDSRIPGPGDRSEGREEEVVDRGGAETEEGCGEGEDEERLDVDAQEVGGREVHDEGGGGCEWGRHGGRIWIG